MIDQGNQVNCPDKEPHHSRLEEKLLAALQTKDLVVTQEELNGRAFVSVLKEKLARQSATGASYF